MPEPAPTSAGPGRLLVAVYALFALAATARSAVQLSTRFSQAPLPYLLSAAAALVYVLATLGLARPGETSRRIALAACSTELAGVLLVGTASLIEPAAFPDQTVWSDLGRDYGYIPLLLPILGLLWLRRTAVAADTRATR